MASSLVAQVLTNMHEGAQVSKDDWNIKISKLSSTVRDLKKDISDSVTSLYDDFVPVMFNFDGMIEKLNELNDEAKELKQTLDTLLRMDLQITQSELNSLLTKYKENKQNLTALQDLAKMVNYFEETTNCLEDNEFTKSANTLAQISNSLLEMKDTALVETKIYETLKLEVVLKREQLLHKLDKSWSNAISWKNLNDEMSTPCLELRFSTEKGGISAQDMIHSLALFNNLDYKLATFANNIVTRVFEPLIKNPNFTPFMNEKKNEATLELMDLEVDVKLEEDDDDVLDMSTFQNVYDCLSFLHRNFFNLKVKSKPQNDDDGSGDAHTEDVLMRMFGDLTCERIMKMLIETCLEKTVPNTREELDKYDQIVTSVQKFEASLQEIDYLNQEKQGRLMEFCSNIDEHFANRRNTLILSQAREMMKKDLLETIEVNNESVQELAVHFCKKLLSEAHGGSSTENQIAVSNQRRATMETDAIQLPTFRVSKFVMELMQLVHTTLYEASDDNTSLESSVKLLSTIGSILDFYQAVVPNDHKRTLSSLPQASAIFYCNCWFISHQLTQLSQYSFNENTPHEFIDKVPKLRQIGMDCFIDQMHTQKEELMGCLEPMQHLAKDQEKYKTCERCVKQILMHMNRLGKVLSSVLPQEATKTAMIILLDACLAQITKCILQIEDMVSSDPEQLRMACILLLEKIPFLFLLGGDKSQQRDLSWQRDMKNWHRMTELIFVLDASMSDIVDRWSDGKGPLADNMSSLEVKSLIRALFQNTERRAKAISSITSI